MAETYYIGKLTGEITKLSQLENDVGFVNHLQINGVELAGNKTSEDLGLMSADASNLSSAGQKVFDGQWVFLNSKILLADKKASATGENFDISDYLPNDNYNYEIMIDISSWGQLESGVSFTISGRTDVIPVDVHLVKGSGLGTSFHAVFGHSVILVVGSQRIITIKGNNNIGFMLNLIGYRRIGLNQ